MRDARMKSRNPRSAAYPERALADGLASEADAGSVWNRREEGAISGVEESGIAAELD